MMVSKCAKFQSHISMDFEKKLKYFKNFNISGYADANARVTTIAKFIVIE
jgi:hypothetical protein